MYKNIGTGITGQNEDFVAQLFAHRPMENRQRIIRSTLQRLARSSALGRVRKKKKETPRDPARTPVEIAPARTLLFSPVIELDVGLTDTARVIASHVSFLFASLVQAHLETSIRPVSRVSPTVLRQQYRRIRPAQAVYRCRCLTL